MKTKEKILSLAISLFASQAMANGQTYDPYENYYSEYYGINAASYATSSEAGVQKLQRGTTTTELKSSNHAFDVSNPANYFNW